MVCSIYRICLFHNYVQLKKSLRWHDIVDLLGNDDGDGGDDNNDDCGDDDDDDGNDGDDDDGGDNYGGDDHCYHYCDCD